MGSDGDTGKKKGEEQPEIVAAKINARAVIVAAITVALTSVIVALISLTNTPSGKPSSASSSQLARGGASASPSVPIRPSHSTGIPAPMSEPSFDPPNPTVHCDYLKIESGQEINAGCGPQNQLTGSAELRYLTPNIVAGPGGQFVQAYPTSQSPSEYYNSCFRNTATHLTKFDAGQVVTPYSNYFCYIIKSRLVVFVRLAHTVDKRTIEIILFEWFPS